ncbi:MAG: OmpA family protein [Tahibacter sp.]
MSRPLLPHNTLCYIGICSLCAAALVLGACSKPATRPAATTPAPAPPAATAAPPPRVPSVKPAVAPPVPSTKGPVVLGSRGFDEGKRRITTALAKDPASALPAPDVGYYLDVLQGRLKQIANTQPGLVVGRQDSEVILDLSARLDFDPGSARITPNMGKMLTPIAKALTEYRMLLVVVKASASDPGDGAADSRLVEQRGLGVAQYLAGAGVALSRIVVAGASSARPAETGTLRETRTQLEIHLEPIVRAADVTRPPESSGRR